VGEAVFTVNGMMDAMTDAPHPRLDELIAVLERLRAPGGCAWDREQTHESLVKYLVEETYELIDAIESGNREEMIEELGDVLYQVIFHSDIAAHTPAEGFTLEDVAAHMTRKMISRHPHVFGDEAMRAEMNIRSADDVVAAWDGLKETEKPHRTSVLDGIPQGMPALALADKVIGRAEKLGVLDADAAAAVSLADETELGGLLLAIVASARVQGLDAERALRSTLRGLQEEIRGAETAEPTDPFDAGIIGTAG
jgi:XTP/dITP diphosphohydrolase